MKLAPRCGDERLYECVVGTARRVKGLSGRSGRMGMLPLLISVTSVIESSIRGRFRPDTWPTMATHNISEHEQARTERDRQQTQEVDELRGNWAALMHARRSATVLFPPSRVIV